MKDGEELLLEFTEVARVLYSCTRWNQSTAVVSGAALRAYWRVTRARRVSVVGVGLLATEVCWAVAASGSWKKQQLQ